MISTKVVRPKVVVLGHVREHLTRHGAIVIPIDIDEDVAKVVKVMRKADGLLLTGGSDVNPDLYGQKPHKANYGLHRRRDAAEIVALQEARRYGVPVMGICRGNQMINVEAGGSLEQNVPDRVGHSEHQYSQHRIRAVQGSTLKRAWGRVGTAMSLHHQAIDRVAKGFFVSAWAPDGTVEGIESYDGRVVGTQFHPEMETSDKSRHLFGLFVEGARLRAERGGIRTPRTTPLPKQPDIYRPIRQPLPQGWQGGTGGQLALPAGHGARNYTRFDDYHDYDGGWGPRNTLGYDPTLDVIDLLEDEPILWCPWHALAFDLTEDHADHMMLFHANKFDSAFNA